ncbi:MarR family winged helix-turn-helix transcriptional regulator [Actinomadura sp. DC4]|uniref:MarR family winged helix-turn-helix transcriptional regulator n=1 Tax=Actinomadura sp. DC4 TaxID=3055069 RepID=UPI0025B070E4|nr:MarR family winged helix-turn-helix transcriptional regulator [Actinomadura sp. DC4]MDN3354089.1 MarR family winged helix-turn-helix transcriptional regulator [Actinomadura sp. DC4]
MTERATGPVRAAEPVGDDVDAVTSAVLTASRLFVSISTRSLAAVDDRVTLPQFRMLVVLATYGEMKLASLAGHLAVNPSTAMRMVDRLVAAGLLDRRTNPADRRENALRLTAPGHRVVDDVTAHRRAEVAAIVTRMPANQRADLVLALRAFTDAGGDLPER